MGFLSRLNDNRRTVASVSTVSVFSTALVGMALWYEGEATADVELNDSGVWVTKTSAGLLGRFNYESQALDGSLLAGSASFDVQQDAGRVLLDDDGTSTASPVDIAHLELSGQVRLPAGAQVASGGATTAILDGEEGLLWVLPFDGATTFKEDETEPVAEIGGDGALAVSHDGTVFVAVPSTGTLWTVGTTARGTAEEPKESSLPVSSGADVAVTAVGGDPVVLDRSGGKLVLPGGETVTLDGADQAQLQQPSASSDKVVVATSTGLVAQPLGGGDAEVRRAEGVPARPVQLDGCTFGAWSSTGQVIRDCAGPDNDVDKRLEGIDPQARLEYRVNRHVIVLNDLSAGTLWMAADEYEKVEDWDLVIPEEAEGEESDAELTNPEQVDQFLADRDQPNRPPKPLDDSFGARPGRTTILPVLANDVDPDGDVMTATLSGESPRNGTVQEIMGGAALQAVVPEDAEGTDTFRYAVSDGRGGTAEAQVTLKISPWGENEIPEQTGDPVLKVAQGGTGTIKVLPFFKDPDGDDMFLASAAATSAGDDVRSRPDGTVEFRDGGGSTGRKIVSLTVSDGQGGLAEGKLLVDVVPGPQPPIAVNDHVVVPAGQPVTVEPLRNDSDPNGDELRLAQVSEAAPAEITPNYDAGTFTFLSNEPRSYDLTYQVTDGPNATTGLVRVDVLPPSAAEGAPVVVADTALLPTGGKTLVDVLANDTDPAGGVLVVQSVSVPDDAGVSVAVLAHQMLRITEVRRLDGPVTIEYTVSNGTETATGQVRVIPVPAPTKLQPPNAAADEVTVHAGDVVTIPVLRNDTHPDGLELFLEPELEQDVDPELGEAFVSEDTLRFKAGPTAGVAYAIYRVRDTNGQEDSAQVTIRIRDGEDNAPPQPREVEARVLSGSSVRVDVPLEGIDPDGDSVQVTGIASPASKGTARVVDGVVEYAASKNSVGLDSFTYAVLDARGATATGTVRVGISRPGETNQPPVAVDDEVTVRPDRTVAINALANDTDPDGDKVGLVPSAIEDEHGMDPEVVGDRIVVTTPRDDGAYTFYYGIQDTYGARATGAVTVNVAADAPLQPPIARDDTVSTADVLGKTTVTVPVLDNDDDPDGAASDLTVTTDAETATVSEDGVLEVTLTEGRQVLTYTVTDIDGLTAKAFVKVPGLTDQVPTLRPGITPLEVYSGEPLDIDITDWVLVVEGRTPRLTVEDKVTALEGTSEVTSLTELTYTSDAGYVGPAAVTFEVTDGSGPDDPDGNTALLTLPIEVLPPENMPPELTGNPTLDVAAGEDASIDLARFATDPDGDALTFRASGQSQGVTVSLEGSTLRAQATPEVPKGTVVTVPITVTDGEHPPVEGSATLTVVASTRPLVRANADTLDDAHQGRASSVDVLANDSNPFPDTPLNLVSAGVETGRGDASVSGSDVVVTPADDFVGVMVVRYRVEDATKDPDRIVDGRLQVTVLGRPEAPSTPQVEEVRSRTVVLSWDPPNNNGSEITGYTVRSQNGYEKQCGTTTCTLDGLTNDVEYTFTVFATNDVGDGPASAPSAVARPDEKPDPPAAPTLEFGDKALTVTWANATYTDRSAIRCVNLRISPAPESGATDKSCVPGTQTTWDGLKNGTSYTVAVQAVNDAPDPSEWGAESAPEVPAGVPDAPAAPSATRVDTALGGQVSVSWTTPFENGDSVKTYYLDVLKGGSVDRTIPVSGATSQTVEGLDPASTYTFRVTAENKAGKSEAGAQSSQVVPYGTPDTPGAPRADLISGDTSQKARVSWNGIADARGTGLYYEVRANGGGARQGGSPMTYTGLANGTAYTFTARACNAYTCSAWSGASNSVTPYGTPPAPSVSGANAGTGSTQTTVSWSTNGTNGRPITMQVRIGGGGWENVGNSGSRTVGNGYSQSIEICGRVVDSEGQTSGTNCATARTGAQPQPQATVSKGAYVSNGNCNDGTCHYFQVTTRDFQDTGNRMVECWTSRNGDHRFGGTTESVPANGTFQVGCYIGYGRPNFPGHDVWVVINGKAYGRTAW